MLFLKDVSKPTLHSNGDACKNSNFFFKTHFIPCFFSSGHRSGLEDNSALQLRRLMPQFCCQTCTDSSHGLDSWCDPDFPKPCCALELGRLGGEPAPSQPPICPSFAVLLNLLAGIFETTLFKLLFCHHGRERGSRD